MQAAARPVIPASAPFQPEQINTLNSVMAQTSVEQRQWLAGFLAGYAAANVGASTQPAALPAPQRHSKIPLTILYATQSGNSEALAYDAKKAASRQGFDAKAVDFADVTPDELAKLSNVLLVAATWGEGDPPERAEGFIKALMGENAPRLEGLSYAVLALGDSSYVNFCETGRQLDARLEALGARRLAARVECDLDFAAPAAAWTKDMLALVKSEAEDADPEVGASVIHVDFAHQALPAAGTRAEPWTAEITELLNLSSSRSTKETWHAVLSLEGSGISYEPGDALGILPENDPFVVEAVLNAARLNGDPPLAGRLQRDLEITTLTRPVLESYAKLSGSEDLKAMLAGEGWRDFIERNHLVDLLRAYPAELDAERLTGLLRKLPPRLYSIASSLKASPDEAHLLVNLVNWRHREQERFGVASSQLARRLKMGDKVKLFIQPNRHFRLPTDASASVVMIGAGTGVAPFRAFMQERRESGANGKNWLVFGERSFTHDFLYQLEWQELMDDGFLTEIDLAFSRDQPEKRYVQHALWDRRQQLFAWLEEGAHLYVCGAMSMGKDVEATLKRIAQEEGREPDGWLEQLRRANRYQRDVY